MFDSFKFTCVKLNTFSTLTLALIILLVIFVHGIVSNASLHLGAASDQIGGNHKSQLQIHQTPQELKVTSEDHDIALAGRERVFHKLNPEELFQSPDFTNRFDSRVRYFFSRNRCSIQIFMTWIAPVDSFGDRDFFSLESLFRTNPKSCVIILSTTMDSLKGQKLLESLSNHGFCIKAITLDLWNLLKNTPAEIWFNDIKNANKDPGKIPLAQNLSNLIRLAVLYKYGGVYIDTDFIALKDLSGLRNSIGAQSVDINGNWTRLNNAVLIFDRNHPLLHRFMEDFVLNYNGDVWGHNGPYLVSRVVNKVAETGEFNHFTVLPPRAFYPVDWTHVAGFFTQPNDRVRAKWVEAKVRQLRGSSYGVHLWNSQSRKFKVEEGSVVGRLISQYCVVCSSSRRLISSRS